MRNPDDALLAQLAGMLRAEHPGALALLVHGSYARGEGAPHSDLDLDLLLDSPPQASYASLIVEREGGRLLHATVAQMTLGDWLESFSPGEEAEAWSFFLPAVERAAIVWATDAARAELAGHLEVVREGSPQLQDILEDAGKVRNARAAGDELRLRLAAHDLATRVPGALALANPPVLVQTRAEALAAALALPVAPEGYREDMLDCLGMSGRAVGAAELHDAAIRLALGVLRLLRPRAASLAGRVEPGIPEYLESGWLERLLTQE